MEKYRSLHHIRGIKVELYATDQAKRRYCITKNYSHSRGFGYVLRMSSDDSTWSVIALGSRKAMQVRLYNILTLDTSYPMQARIQQALIQQSAWVDS